MAFQLGAFQDDAFQVEPENFVALAATEAPDTAAFSAAAGPALSLAATEQQDVAALTATAGPALSLVATEAQDTAALTATAGPGVTFAVTEAPDVAALTASVGPYLSFGPAFQVEAFQFDAFQDVGSGGAVEAADTADFAARIETIITLAATEAQDTFTTSAVIPTSFYVDSEVFYRRQELRAFTVPFERRDFYKQAESTVFERKGEARVSRTRNRRRPV